MDKINKNKTRYPLIDALRGSAIIMMIVFHFSFDLALFKYADFDFYHSPYWLNFRILIVTIFTFVMGMSLYLANKNGIIWYKYFKRIAVLLAAALLVTISTWFTSGERFIYFGILHFIVVASLVAIPFLKLYWSNLVIGLILIIIANLYTNPMFHNIYLQWIGFMEHKPATDDYAPLLPWFGIVLIGIFFARWAITEKQVDFIQNWQIRSSFSRWLVFAGIHSLLIYLLHQPLFFGLFNLIEIVNR
ncbi:hypothetical protein MNBD_GAMMA21-152 [hydrothermal vent metagenome]|uniref:Heparan-alpha-glucosaminide N-acetyltransferase catalytic domain-containing protein n=1 Tax=hydrothermal vent metagenome TaxID=652676 RepID=A0A3B1AMG0_9ZZZZ